MSHPKDSIPDNRIGSAGPFSAFRVLMQRRDYRLVWPAVSRACGGVVESLIWHELAYRSEFEDEDGWISLTADDIEYETTITRRQQERARKVLRDRGLLEEKRAGQPARLWFRIDWDAMERALVGDPSFDKTSNQDAPERRIKMHRSAELESPKGETISYRKESSKNRDTQSNSKKSRKRTVPPPPKRPPTWQTHDPVTDRAELLRSPYRPDVPSPADVNSDIELVFAWQKLQQEWDSRRRQRAS